MASKNLNLLYKDTFKVSERIKNQGPSSRRRLYLGKSPEASGNCLIQVIAKTSLKLTHLLLSKMMAACLSSFCIVI